MEKKKIWIAVILMISAGLIIEGSLTITNPSDLGSEFMNLPENQIRGNGLGYDILNDGSHRFTFEQSDAYIEIGNQRIDNVIPQDTAGTPTYVEFDSDGRLTEFDFWNSDNTDYTVGDMNIHVPKGSRNILDGTEVQIIIPEGKTLESFPTNTPSNYLNDIYATIEGRGSYLPDGSLLNGELNWQDGEARIFLNNPPVINNIEVNTLSSEQLRELSMNVYFEETPPGVGNSISFDIPNRNVVFSSQDGNSIFNFNPGNPFIDIGQNNLFSVQNLPASTIGIQNRQEQGLIVEIVPRGNSIINDGTKIIEIDNGEVYLHNREISGAEQTPANTIPIEVRPLNEKGTAILEGANKARKKETNNIFIGDKSNIAVAPEKESKEIASTNGVDEKSSARIKYNYNEESPEKEKPILTLFKKVVGRLRNLRPSETRDIPTAVAGVKG